MTVVPNLLTLGAASRNVGKTEFACALIRRFAQTQPVFAVKITTVQERDGLCPRGGKGCGVCSSLCDTFDISEDDPAHTDPSKDTARMRAAGARQVFWLRVLRDHLEEGVTALLARIPPGACTVCESNSVRQVIEPGAFLIIRDPETTAIKASCAAVLPLADRIVGFHGDGWDFSPDRCAFSNGRWSVPLAATVAVLAGGRSRRMGQDKSLMPFRGRPLLGHILDQLRPLADELLVGANDPDRFAFAGCPIIPDEEPDQGPLMGILSCLTAASHDRVLVTACDIPERPLDFLRDLLRRASHADIVMPRNADGRCEPLLAVYTRRIIPVVRAVLARGERRITALCDEPGIRTDPVPMPPGDWYHNLNTPEDYRRILHP